MPQPINLVFAKQVSEETYEAFETCTFYVEDLIGQNWISCIQDDTYSFVKYDGTQDLDYSLLFDRGEGVVNTLEETFNPSNTYWVLVKDNKAYGSISAAQGSPKHDLYIESFSNKVILISVNDGIPVPLGAIWNGSEFIIP